MSDLERPDFDCPIDDPGCGKCLMCKSFHGYPLDEPISYVPTDKDIPMGHDLSMPLEKCERCRYLD